MTETRTETPGPVAPVPVGAALGQAIGQAQNVLSALLDSAVAEAGAAREAYIALQRLMFLGDAAAREDYVHDLGDILGLGPAPAGQLADRLVTEGVLALADGTVRPSAAGAELRERAQDAVRETMAPVWAHFDAAQLETTARTLHDITQRARELYPAEDTRR